MSPRIPSFLSVSFESRNPIPNTVFICQPVHPAMITLAPPPSYEASTCSFRWLPQEFRAPEILTLLFLYCQISADAAKCFHSNMVSDGDYYECCAFIKGKDKGRTNTLEIPDINNKRQAMVKSRILHEM